MPLPAQPFTLWLSPDSWPRPALRLPGNACTLWQNPDTWPKPRLRLPGSAHTLWLDESRWPVTAVRTVPVAENPSGEIPAADPVMEVIPEPVVDLVSEINAPGPASVPVEPIADAPPEPVREPVIEPIVESVPEPLEEVTVIAEVETPPEPAGIAQSVPLTPAASHHPVTVPLMNLPIKLPANHSFTLWSSPAAVASLIARQPVPAAPVRAMVRLPGQPFTLWTQPGRVDRITMTNPAAPAAGRPVVARESANSNRWLPLTAGIGLAALFALGFFSQSSQREKAESDLAQLKTETAAVVSTAQVQAKAAGIAAEKSASELKAKEADFTGEIARLKTALTETGDAVKKADAAVAGTTAALDKVKKELAGAKSEFSAKESALQNNLATLTEESSKVKRLAGEEAAKARETIAKLEEAKAAALKEAAAATAERDVLKVEVEKLRKQLQSPSKPPGTPEA